ncbi:MAG: hypothetical protein M1822_005781 [Bathelium mastoideum]|nr:MAG: hypothetical protein M1822_005781 [Bathelium mastoideum]
MATPCLMGLPRELKIKILSYSLSYAYRDPGDDLREIHFHDGDSAPLALCRELRELGLEFLYTYGILTIRFERVGVQLGIYQAEPFEWDPEIPDGIMNRHKIFVPIDISRMRHCYVDMYAISKRQYKGKDDYGDPSTEFPIQELLKQLQKVAKIRTLTVRCESSWRPSWGPPRGIETMDEIARCRNEGYRVLGGPGKSLIERDLLEHLKVLRVSQEVDIKAEHVDSSWTKRLEKQILGMTATGTVK